jgi:hypothetical protein
LLLLSLSLSLSCAERLGLGRRSLPAL